jgi:hypothetical protein
MATREQVHKLVDELSETDLDPVAEILIWRRQNGTLADAAMPGDIIDEWGNLSAMARASTTEAMHRLDEEEIATSGETLADSWARESPR